MRVLAVSVGLPKTVEWKGREVSTGIFKSPVEGKVRAEGINLAGDRQADLTVHGGPEKAVYCYPFEHYPAWEEFLGKPLPMAAMGENLTVEGLLEEDLCIGDRLRIGTAEFVVVQPRQPCFKFAIRHGRDDALRHFLTRNWSGYYLTIVKSGELEAGDAIEILSRDPHKVRVSDLFAIFRREPTTVEFLQRAVQVEALTDQWRDFLADSIEAALG